MTSESPTPDEQVRGIMANKLQAAEALAAVMTTTIWLLDRLAETTPEDEPDGWANALLGLTRARAPINMALADWKAAQ